MADTDSLEVRVGGDASQLGPVVDAVSRLETGLAAVRAQGAAAGEGMAAGAAAATPPMTILGDVTIKVGAATKAAAESAGALGTGLDYVAAHARTASIALESVGLEASAVSAKMAALAELGAGLEKTFAPLLALFVAIEAGAKVFEFLKESVADASRAELQMIAIGTAVKNNGQNWEELRGHVERFIEEEARFTGYAQGELRTAFNTIIEAGHSTADAYQIMAVAEDTARAKGLDVEEVTRRIIQAEAGRALGLAQLDPRLKDLIKDHADLATILTQLAHDMDGQAAAAADSYAVAVGRLNTAWDTFKEDVGGWLLPWLTDVINRFTDLVDAIHRAVDALNHVQQGAANAKKTHASEQHAASFDAIAGALGAGDAGDIWSPVGIEVNNAQYDNARKRAAAAERHAKSAKGIHLDRNPDVGMGAGGSDAGFDPSYADINLQSVDRVIAAQDELTKKLGLRKEAEAAAAEAVKLATSSEDEYARKVAEATIKTNDAKASIADLTHQRIAEEHEIRALATQQKAQEQTLRDASAAEHAFGEAHKGAKLSPEEKEEWKGLQKAVSEAQRAYDKTTSTLKTLESQYAANGKALAQAKLDQNAYNEMVEAGVKAINDFIAAQERQRQDLVGTYGRGRQDQLHYWQSVADANRPDLLHPVDPERIKRYEQAMAEIAKLSQQANVIDPRNLDKLQKQLGDEEAIYKKSLEEQRAYWLTKLAGVREYGEAYTGQTAEIEQKVAQLDKQIYEQRIDEALKFYKQVEGYETTFVDDVLGKHLSLRDALKNVWQQILSDFVKMIEEMIAKTALFQGVEAKLQQIFGQIFGKSGGSGSGVPGISVGSSGGGADMANASFGSWGGSSPFDQLAAANPSWMQGLPVNITGVGGVSVNAGDGVPNNVTQVGGKSVFSGGGASGALGGLMIAQVVNGITGGNQTWADVGGAVGGAFGGPIGAAAGSFIGGMFGPHWGPPSNYPDRSDPQNYGTLLSDWQGAVSGANGQNFTPAQQYYTAAGGTSLSQQMEQWANSVKNNTSGLTALQQQLDQQILALENGNPNANLGITGLHNGVWTLGSGAQISYQDAQTLAQNFQTAVGGAAANYPVFSIARDYPNFSGTMTNTGASVASTGQVVSTTPGGASGPVVSAGGVYQDFRNATFVGPRGLDEASVAIGQSLQRANSGLVAGSPSGYGSASRVIANARRSV